MGRAVIVVLGARVGEAKVRALVHVPPRALAAHGKEEILLPWRAYHLGRTVAENNDAGRLVDLAHTDRREVHWQHVVGGDVPSTARLMVVGALGPSRTN